MSSFPPSFLYQLTARDEQVTGIEIVQFYSSIVSSAATIVDTGVAGANSGFYVVPKGRLLVVQAFTIESLPGAAQSIQYHSMQVSRDYSAAGMLNAIPVFSVSHANAAGNNMRSGSFQMNEILVPEGGCVGAKAQFSAGAAANSLQFFMHGFTIPRGNVAI